MQVKCEIAAAKYALDILLFQLFTCRHIYITELVTNGMQSDRSVRIDGQFTDRCVTLGETLFLLHFVAKLQHGEDGVASSLARQMCAISDAITG